MNLAFAVEMGHNPLNYPYEIHSIEHNYFKNIYSRLLKHLP